MAMGLDSEDLEDLGDEVLKLLKGGVFANPFVSELGDPYSDCCDAPKRNGEFCWKGPRGGGISSAGDRAYSGLNS